MGGTRNRASREKGSDMQLRSDAVRCGTARAPHRSLLKADGITILMVTHDVAFAAENADRCALFFDGEVLSADVPERFFAENNFYTTAANRMARHFWKYAVTCEQVTAYAREALRASAAAGARGEQA